MSVMIYNPTNETFEMMFGGKTIFLPAGEKMKVDDSCGRHLLNGFTTRGLAVLDFDSNLEEVTADGKARNMNFKKRMVMEHNHRNVVRKQQGLSYTEPTKTMRQYAEELGITLDEPYATRDKENDRLVLLERENQDLRKSIAETNDLIRQMMAEKNAAKKEEQSSQEALKSLQQAAAISNTQTSTETNKIPIPQQGSKGK